MVGQFSSAAKLSYFVLLLFRRPTAGDIEPSMHDEKVSALRTEIQNMEKRIQRQQTGLISLFSEVSAKRRRLTELSEHRDKCMADIGAFEQAIVDDEVKNAKVMAKLCDELR